MDRRQRKTREAIFTAFTALLAEKDFGKITVGEIIARADVGRATFYAHFETKDFLLRELCGELFCHIFDAMEENPDGHRHIFTCDAPDSAFLHLFRHLQQNDNGILTLLTCRNNELFLQEFRKQFRELLRRHPALLPAGKSGSLPEDFRMHHAASAFVETVRWWMENGRKESAETVTGYFLQIV